MEENHSTHKQNNPKPDISRTRPKKQAADNPSGAKKRKKQAAKKNRKTFGELWSNASSFKRAEMIGLACAAFGGVAGVLYVLSYIGFSIWDRITVPASVKSGERPYLSVEDDVLPAGIMEIPGAQILAARFFYDNTGKSPALHVRTHAYIHAGPACLANTDAWFERLDSGKMKDPIDYGIPPEFNSEFTVTQGEKKIQNVSGMLQPPDFQSTPYTIVGRLDYFDKYGTHYWTDVCWYIIAGPNSPPLIMHCAKHNEIH
jgi:hypothetical protein